MNAVALHSIEDDIRAALLQNRRQGLQLMYDHFGPIVYGLLMNAGLDDETAQAMLETTFIEHVNGLGAGDATRSLLTGLLCTARRLASGSIGKPGRGQADVDELCALIHHEGDHGTSAVCAKMLELVYYKAYTAQHLAECAGLPESAVLQNIRKALKDVSE